LSEFKEEMEIDLDNLHVDFADHPLLHLKYAEKAAYASKAAKRAAEKKKIIRSELIMKVNKNPGLLGEAKLNMQTSEAYYRSQPEYQEAVEELIEAEYLDETFKSLMFILNDRKVSLENEVKLWLGQYYAGPREPKDTNIKQLGKEERRDRIGERKARRRSKRSEQ